MQNLEPAIALAKKWEGLVLTAYRDIVGVLTLGFGHTGPDVRPGLTITPDQAETFLRMDMDHAANAVKNFCKRKLTNNQLCALSDFVFNLGAGAFHHSTLLYDLNHGLSDTQCVAELSRWIHAGGEIVPGLAKRRRDELELFLKPDQVLAVPA